MGAERREYPRAATEIIVQFCLDSESEERVNQEYYVGVVENCSAGGMYVSTDNPVPRGSNVRIKFCLSSRRSTPLPVQARAVVRWVRYVSKPHGMGLEFLGFEGIDDQDFTEWITSLLG